MQKIGELIVMNFIRNLIRSNHSDSFIKKLEAAIRANIPFVFNDNLHSGFPSDNDYVVSDSCITDMFLWYDVYKPRLKKMNLNDFNEVYKLLFDNYSKEIFIKLIVFKFFEQNKVRLPLYYSYPFRAMKYYKNFEVNGNDKQYNLNKLGFELVVSGSYENIAYEFIENQFFYFDKVDLKKGDIVLECGVGSGLSSVHFASITESKVYCLEWKKESLEALKTNIALNCRLKDCFDITVSLVSEKADQSLYVLSYQNDYHFDTINIPESVHYKTASVDSFVSEKKIESLAFLKFDLTEDLESAVKGAAETIRKFMPKLVLTLSAKENNLVVIPQLLKSIYPDYKLALRHNSCSDISTVLYAFI